MINDLFDPAMDAFFKVYALLNRFKTLSKMVAIGETFQMKPMITSLGNSHFSFFLREYEDTSLMNSRMNLEAFHF